MKAFIALCMVALAVAEPEADPQLLYSNLGYSAYTPYTLGAYAPYTAAYTTYAGAYAPYTYGAYSAYAPYFAGRIFKREAEAEADPQLLYSGLNAISYGLPYTGYNFGAWAPYAATYAAAPAVYSTPAIYAAAAPAAIPAVPGGYAAAGRYVANSAGTVHVAKREAEAEADPQFLYNNLAYSAYTPYTLGAYAPYRAAYTTYAGAYAPYTLGYRAGFYGRFF